MSSARYAPLPNAHTDPDMHREMEAAFDDSDDEEDSEEDENDERGARDEAMDRSPTPERRRAALPKRTRLGPSASDKHGNGSKESKSEEQDVDVGVLLGQSCLDLVLACLWKHA